MNARVRMWAGCPHPACLILVVALACAHSLFAADPAATPPADSVIYPRTAATPGTPAEKPASSLGPTTALAVVMLVGAGAWFLWRSRRDGGLAAARSERKLAIAETRSLGNRQFLVVATYEDRKFLLGVCPGRIDLLTPLSGAAQQENETVLPAAFRL